MKQTDALIERVTLLRPQPGDVVVLTFALGARSYDVGPTMKTISDLTGCPVILLREGESLEVHGVEKLIALRQSVGDLS